MLTKSLRRMGVTSDLAYLAGLLSIGASIATWAVARRNSDPGHAERFGIFIGLWPPTFFVSATRSSKKRKRHSGPPAERMSGPSR